VGTNLGLQIGPGNQKRWKHQIHYVQVKNHGQAVTDLEQCALDNYQQLIEPYTQQKKPEANLKEMTA
jgi:hypothetical protein